MSHLIRLIYVSRATGELELPALEALLAQARAHNAKVGLTGVLCAGRGYFVQVLEGPEQEALATYAKILADDRHHNSSLLCIGLVAHRMFGDWAMAHVPGDLLGDDTYRRLMNQVVVRRDLSEPAQLLQRALKALRHED